MISESSLKLAIEKITYLLIIQKSRLTFFDMVVFSYIIDNKVSIFMFNNTYK